MPVALATRDLPTPPPGVHDEQHPDASALQAMLGVGVRLQALPGEHLHLSGVRHAPLQVVLVVPASPGQQA